MRDLTELVCFLPWRKLQTSPLWDVILQPNSKMARLFDIIQSQQATTEAEAAALLYGSSGSIAKLQS